MNKIGLVLSGGGIRGIAHLGLLKAMDEIGVKPAAISGVSAGAIIGALYASGISPDEILDIGKRQINFGFSNLLWRRGGLFSREFIHKILVEYKDSLICKCYRLHQSRKCLFFQRGINSMH